MVPRLAFSSLPPSKTYRLRLPFGSVFRQRSKVGLDLQAGNKDSLKIGKGILRRHCPLNSDTLEITWQSTVLKDRHTSRVEAESIAWQSKGKSVSVLFLQSLRGPRFRQGVGWCEVACEIGIFRRKKNDKEGELLEKQKWSRAADFDDLALRSKKPT